MLLPLRRDSERYQTLLGAHDNAMESVFDHWRDRYGVAGNSNANRPKRQQSLPCQHLRACAGLLLEWFRICLRQGWLASPARRNANHPRPRRVPELALRKIAAERRRRCLNLPYGPAAEALGLVRAGPPDPVVRTAADDALPF